MDLEDGFTALKVGGFHGYLTVEPAGPEQGRIQNVGTVGGCNDDQVGVIVEAVHLHQQLVQGLLALIVATAHAGAALAAHSIDLVDEDDGRCILLGLIEQVAHSRGAQSDEHLDEVRACHGVEGHAGLTGYGPGQQGLAGSRGTIEQNASGYAGTQGLVLGGILEEFLDLLHLLDCGLLAGHVRELGLGGLPVAELGGVLLAPHAEHAAAGRRGHAREQEPKDSQNDQHGQDGGDQVAHHAGLRHHRVVPLGGLGLLYGLDHLLPLGLHVVELYVLAEVLGGAVAAEAGHILDEVTIELELDDLHFLGDLGLLDHAAAVVQQLQAVLGIDGLSAVLAAEEAEDGQDDDHGQNPPEPGGTPEGAVAPIGARTVVAQVEVEGVVALVSVVLAPIGRTLLRSLRVAHDCSP